KSLKKQLKQSLDTPVVQHLQETRHLQGLADEADFLSKRVGDALEGIHGIKSRFLFLTSFKWTMLRPEIEACIPPMTSLQTQLDLIIGVIQLERTRELLQA